MTSTVRETWLANRLISAAAETVEDGETTRTSVRRDADMLVVVTNTGERRLTGDIATTSFWNLTRLPGGVLTFLDVESGTDFQARAQFVKETQITVKGNAVPCRLWQLSADTETQLWFDRDDILVRLEYEEQGQRFVHSLDRRTIIQPKEQP